MPSSVNQDNKGVLYLIPNIIHPNTENQVIAPVILDTIKQVDYFLVENLRTARRYISALMRSLPESDRIAIEQLTFEKLDKKTTPEELSRLMEPIMSGRNCGIISESGCPGIADPGSEAVFAAHRFGIEVVPLPGPSSIFMALMASGMNGQSFAFHGYLPVETPKLITRIRQIESTSRQLNQTQIFIETPYRNQRIYETLISTCANNTLLCIAQDISGKGAFIKSMTIGKWRSENMAFEKVPVVYLLLG